MCVVWELGMCVNSVLILYDFVTQPSDTSVT